MEGVELVEDVALQEGAVGEGVVDLPLFNKGFENVGVVIELVVLVRHEVLVYREDLVTLSEIHLVFIMRQKLD